MATPKQGTKSLPSDQKEAARAFVRKLVDREFGGNVSAAAKSLGIAQSMLHDFLKGNKGPGMKMLGAVAAHARTTIDQVVGLTALESTSSATKSMLGPVEPPAEERLTQLVALLPESILRDLDEWIASLNQQRRFGKLNRTTILQAILERETFHRPILDDRGTPESPIAVLHDEQGREQKSVPLKLIPPTIIEISKTTRACITRAHYQMLNVPLGNYALEQVPNKFEKSPEDSEECPAFLQAFQESHGSGTRYIGTPLAGTLKAGQFIQTEVPLHPNKHYVGLGIAEDGQGKFIIELLLPWAASPFACSSPDTMAVFGQWQDVRCPSPLPISVYFRVVALEDTNILTAALFESLNTYPPLPPDDNLFREISHTKVNPPGLRPSDG